MSDTGELIRGDVATGDGYLGGWRHDLEDWEHLAALPDDWQVMAMSGTFDEVRLDPRDVLKIENQSNQGACQGHALSSVVEWVHCIQTGDFSLQLSRAMGYYETQRLDGIRGDRGSTISGGVKLAMNTGICAETFWTYPSRYSNGRPRNYDAVLQSAAKYKIGTSLRLRSYDAIRTFLGAGLGGISIGIAWSSRVMSRAIVERYSTGGGGHAIGLFALSKRLDKKGRPYVWMMNSWGSKWPANANTRGWSEWAPSAVEQIMRSGRTTAIGLSDMPNLAPRTFTLEDWKRRLTA